MPNLKLSQGVESGIEQPVEGGGSDLRLVVRSTRHSCEYYYVRNGAQASPTFRSLEAAAAWLRENSRLK